MSAIHAHDAGVINPTLTAGDTWSWSESVPLYPASAGFTLSYALIKPGTRVVLTATADGDDYSFDITAANTSTYSAGAYAWTASVAKGSGPSAERYTLASGTIEVKANLAGMSGGYDARSQSRKILEALQAAYETHISGGSGHVAEYEIAGRRMKFRSADEIIVQINYWKAEVKAEERREAIANGQAPANKLLVRF